jgi:dTMP kinase
MAREMKGFFLTVEGIEGCGKTTQLKRLAKQLRDAGRNCVTTKEPGGTPIGDRVRAILLDPQAEGMDALSELFLLAASRRQNVVELVQPALEKGAIVLCDRFADASVVYQGYGRGLDLQQVIDINDWATNGITPDITLVFDLPEAAGLERARARNATENLMAESRLEGEDLAFHRRVREGYLALATQERERFAVIDAAPPVDEVYAEVVRVLRDRAPALRIGEP